MRIQSSDIFYQLLTILLTSQTSALEMNANGIEGNKDFHNIAGTVKRNIDRNIKIINGSLTKSHEFPGAICLYQRNTLFYLFPYYQYKCSGKSKLNRKTYMVFLKIIYFCLSRFKCIAVTPIGLGNALVYKTLDRVRVALLVVFLQKYGRGHGT